MVEFAAGIASQLMGEVVENVSAGIDTYSLRQPLGVSAPGLKGRETGHGAGTQAGMSAHCKPTLQNTPCAGLPLAAGPAPLAHPQHRHQHHDPLHPIAIPRVPATPLPSFYLPSHSAPPSPAVKLVRPAGIHVALLIHLLIHQACLAPPGDRGCMHPGPQSTATRIYSVPLIPSLISSLYPPPPPHTPGDRGGVRLQLPGHDPPLALPAGHRRRQLHAAQALREGPGGGPAAGGAGAGGGWVGETRQQGGVRVMVVGVGLGAGAMCVELWVDGWVKFHKFHPALLLIGIRIVHSSSHLCALQAHSYEACPGACSTSCTAPPPSRTTSRASTHTPNPEVIAPWTFPLTFPPAGLPKGVLNVVHGTHLTVNRILDHPDIKAVSFVGGSAAGRYIYERGAANGKRVQVRAACIWQ